jgi:hypothetical protein
VAGTSSGSCRKAGLSVSGDDLRVLRANSQHFKAQFSPYIPHALIYQNSAFCP